MGGYWCYLKMFLETGGVATQFLIQIGMLVTMGVGHGAVMEFATKGRREWDSRNRRRL